MTHIFFTQVKSTSNVIVLYSFHTDICSVKTDIEIYIKIANSINPRMCVYVCGVMCVTVCVCQCMCVCVLYVLECVNTARHPARSDSVCWSQLLFIPHVFYFNYPVFPLNVSIIIRLIKFIKYRVMITLFQQNLREGG